MPINIKTGVLNYKDPTSGQYVGFDMITGSNSIIADDYSSQQTYLKDEYCIYNCKLYKANQNISTAEAWTAAHWTETTVATELGGAGAIDDVQVNGTSVVSGGVANIPEMSYDVAGVMKKGSGLSIVNGRLEPNNASDNNIKVGTSTTNVLIPARQHASAFYGLAKAAGDTTQSASANAVGTYTDSAKAAIQTMLGVGMNRTLVSGTTPTITAVSNTLYICGEVSTLSITPPGSGVFSVIFESGSTPTVLTLDSSIKCPVWFDSSDLESDMIYELNCNEGLLSVGMWEAT